MPTTDLVLNADHRILKLVNGPFYWFEESTSPVELIRDTVPASLRGVYCLWWKNRATLPRARIVELDAGKRGKLSVELKLHDYGLSQAAALYVGKGAVRTRLTSHVKPAPGRNPYWWITQVFTESTPDMVIKSQLGFSIFEEPSPFEQVYLENLAVGLLRPWFNFRFTA